MSLESDENRKTPLKFQQERNLRPLHMRSKSSIPLESSGSNKNGVSTAVLDLTRDDTTEFSAHGPNRSAAELLIDGSPSKSPHLMRKLDRSTRKIAVVTQRAYCIISSKPLHLIYFQVL